MSREAKAITQYGDLKGTIGVDGFNGIAIWTDFKPDQIHVPAGYHPVGVDIYDEPERDGKFAPTVYLLAVDRSILGEGHTPEAVKRYAKEHGVVPVLRFRTDIKVKDLLPLIKRINVVLKDKIVGDAKLMVSEEHSL